MKQLVLLAAVLAGGCATPAPGPDEPVAHPAHGRETPCDFCDVYREVRQGVVLIRRDGGIGSGMIVSPSGRVLTAAHIVRNLHRVDVRLFGGEERKARVLRSDPDLDLALLQIEGPPRNLVPVPLEEDDARAEGQAVLVVGHPFGLTWSITRGIISAVRGPDDGTLPNVLQVDAGVNPGNSGGPVLNEEGHCLGIVISKVIRGGAENLGFARPVSVVREFMAHSRTDEEGEAP